MKLELYIDREVEDIDRQRVGCVIFRADMCPQIRQDTMAKACI